MSLGLSQCERDNLFSPQVHIMWGGGVVMGKPAYNKLFRDLAGGFAKRPHLSDHRRSYSLRYIEYK